MTDAKRPPRSIETILLRFKADLPITNEEVAIAQKHLDKVLASQRRTPKILAISLLVILAAIFLVGYFSGAKP